MASESELVELVQLVHDFASLKLYAVSVTALWAYDYFLTLKDEVLYAWKMESVPMFSLFLFTRYLPGLFQAWIAVLLFHPGYTSEVCKKTAFLQLVYLTFMNAAAQAVLTQRTYAITGKKKWIAGILYTVSIVQFVVGVYMFVWSAMNHGQYFHPMAHIRPSSGTKGTFSAAEAPGIPPGPYHICLANPGKGFIIFQFSLSLSFDVLVFVFALIQTQLIASVRQGTGASDILDTVTRDAVLYFILISTSHFLILIMLAVARPALRSIPVAANAVLLPVMIGRMTISLKKVASSQRSSMSMGVSTGLPMNLQDIYSPHPVGGIQLSVLKS